VGHSNGGEGEPNLLFFNTQETTLPKWKGGVARTIEAGAVGMRNEKRGWNFGEAGVVGTRGKPRDTLGWRAKASPGGGKKREIKLKVEPKRK